MTVSSHGDSGTFTRIAPYLAGLGFAVIFGMSFIFTKAALDRVDFLRLLGFRFAIAALAVSLLHVLGVVKIKLKGKDLRPVLMASAFQPIAYFLFETNGVMRSSTSQAGMMIALIPIAVAVLSRVLLGERASVRQLLCIILSVSGVAVIASYNGGQADIQNTAGLWFLLGAVFSAAFYNILSRRSAIQFKPIEITFVMMWMGAVVFNLLSVISHWRSGTLPGYFAPFGMSEVVVSLLYLGVISSVLAFFFVNFAISRLPVSQAAVFANLVTVVSIAAGVVIRGESFGLVSFVGASMIILGVFGTNYFGQLEKRKRGIATADGV